MTRNDLKRREELKRERNWNAQMRWKVLQDTLTWADAQANVQHNTPTRRLEEQARKIRKNACVPLKIHKSRDLPEQILKNTSALIL